LVRTIAPHTEADPVALVLQILVAFGNVIGRKPHFYVGQTRHGLNLYTVLVGKTARARKGSSWDFVASPFRRLDPGWADECVQGGLSTGEGVIARAAGRTLPKDERVLFLEEEFASVLEVMGRRNSTLSMTMRRGWDGRTLQVLTRHEPLFVKDAHISMIGHVTQHNLLKSASQADIHGGLFNRILFGCIQRVQLLPDGGKVPQAELDRLTQSMKDAIRFASRNLNVLFSNRSRKLWRTVYVRLSDPPLQDPTIDAVTARAEAQVRRIAVLYALLDRSRIVKVQHLRAGLEVWRFCDESARFVFGPMVPRSLEDRILEILAASGTPMGRTAISQKLSHHCASDEITVALRKLRAAGRAQAITVPTGGRSAEQWTVTGKH
jgi:hypothetical protein